MEVLLSRLAHLVTGLAAATVLLGIVGIASSAEGDRLRTKVMKANADTQGSLAGNLKASIKRKRTSTTMLKTKGDTTKSSISNIK
jgi:hypothetical protein